MRGTVTGLDSPHPLGGLMPAVYQDDNFTMRWTAALDDVLAPVMASQTRKSSGASSGST